MGLPHRGPYDWGWVTDAEGNFIAQAKDPRANTPEILDLHRAAKTDPWEANARLIASAPDLLEALRQIAAGGLAPVQMQEIALQAIAKAEGRS